MNRQYDDILGLTTTKPSFFQEGGVPRWGAFEPGVSTGIYAQEAVIAEIACQLCDTRFHVLIERRSHDGKTPLATDIQKGELAYRDPPNVGCCIGGPSMTSETVRVLEYWFRASPAVGRRWTRTPGNEIAFRRFGDPWTPEMRAKAEAFANDPDNTESDRANMRKAIEQDSYNVADEAARKAAPIPIVYETEYLSASAPESDR